MCGRERRDVARVGMEGACTAAPGGAMLAGDAPGTVSHGVPPSWSWVRHCTIFHLKFLLLQVKRLGYYTSIASRFPPISNLESFYWYLVDTPTQTEN